MTFSSTSFVLCPSIDKQNQSLVHAHRDAKMQDAILLSLCLEHEDIMVGLVNNRRRDVEVHLKSSPMSNYLSGLFPTS